MCTRATRQDVPSVLKPKLATKVQKPSICDFGALSDRDEVLAKQRVGVWVQISLRHLDATLRSARKVTHMLFGASAGSLYLSAGFSLSSNPELLVLLRASSHTRHRLLVLCPDAA